MRGEVVYLYAFDVAGEIVINGLTELLGRPLARFRLPPDRTYPRAVPLHQPLGLDLPPWTDENETPIQVNARIYGVGVIHVSVHVRFEVEHWQDLLPYHRPTLADGESFEHRARSLCEEICRALADKLRHASPVTAPEAYTVFCIREMAEIEDINRLSTLDRRAIAGLLTETPAERLAPAQVEEVWRLQRSFELTDLVVIDWDAALLVNLAGSLTEELFVLELANLQLEEFRVMDERLDQYLEQAYEDLERSSTWSFATSGRVLKALRRFRVDLTKLADDVTHITKFLGDWHLARVYMAAQQRFYLDAWKQSVDQRLKQLDELYRVAHTDVYDRRMMWMEAAIVVCFLIDIFALFFWKH